MKKLNIAFIGVGSIAKRHMGNLVACMGERGWDYQIDVVRSGHGAGLDGTLATWIHGSYVYGEEIPKDYDVVFVTNPTALHYETIQKYAASTKSMFIEKPVFHHPNLDVGKLMLKEDGIYYVACPLRYTGVVQYLKNHIGCSRVFSARAICSSYLPEWRPGTDYRTSYSAHKRLGGGVSIDLIHEWDYMSYLFGFPDKVVNMRGTYSKLEIDSEDCSVYIAQSGTMLYELHLDYFGRGRMRQVELFLEGDTVVGDLEKAEVRFLRSGKTISFQEQRNDSQKREISNFLDILEGTAKNENSIETALKVLKIAQGGEG